MAHGLPTGILCHHLGGVGGAFAGAFEATLASAGPSDDSPTEICDTNDGVVEAGLNVGNTLYNAFAAFGFDNLDWLNGIVKRDTYGSGSSGGG